MVAPWSEFSEKNFISFPQLYVVAPPCSSLRNHDKNQNTSKKRCLRTHSHAWSAPTSVLSICKTVDWNSPLGETWDGSHVLSHFKNQTCRCWMTSFVVLDGNLRCYNQVSFRPAGVAVGNEKFAFFPLPSLVLMSRSCFRIYVFFTSNLRRWLIIYFEVRLVYSILLHSACWQHLPFFCTTKVTGNKGIIIWSFPTCGNEAFKRVHNTSVSIHCTGHSIELFLRM